MITRSSKAKKFILGILILCFLLKWRSSVGNSRGRRRNKLGLPTPLLEQPLDRQFNSRRVWVSIGLCYRQHSDLVQASLAATLWKTLAHVNVILQVFNDSAVPSPHLEMLDTLRGTGIQVELHEVATESLPDDDICDCGLEAALAGPLAASSLNLQDEDILLIADATAFLSKPHILNAFRSGHKSWMFITEAVFYGGLPWPASLTAMTGSNWRKIASNSSSCHQLQQADSRLRERYSPSWKEEAEKARASALGEQMATQFRQMVEQVDRFEKGLNLEKTGVGLQKLENSSLAEFAAEIHRDGDQFLRILNKAQIDEGSFRDLINLSRESNARGTDIAVKLLHHILQAHLRASGEKDSNLVRLEPILAQVQQSTDQETSQIKLLWEPVLKLNTSTIPFPDNVVDFPKIAAKRQEVVIWKAKSAVDHFVTLQVLVNKMCNIPPWNNLWGALGIGAFYDVDFVDQDICYKGMGLASCNNALGYWHYPGMPGCNWWMDRFPSERLEEVLPARHPVRDWVEQLGSQILFSSH